jgi:phospholipid-binding lipoprotein MlaA
MRPDVASPRAEFAPPGSPEAAGDPLQPLNRGLFRVGLALDRAVARPVARTYGRVAPRPARRAIHNVLANLDAPVVFMNDVLQLRPRRAARTAARFVSNSALGVGGIFDVAARGGLPEQDNDFGATLAHYGVGAGPYIFVPLLGPTTLRDLAGLGVDFAADPFNKAQFHSLQAFDTTRTSLSLLDARETAGADLQALEAGAADPYATVRTAYLQHRSAELNGGQAELEALPDLPPAPVEVSAATP